MYTGKGKGKGGSGGMKKKKTTYTYNGACRPTDTCFAFLRVPLFSHDSFYFNRQGQRKRQGKREGRERNGNGRRDEQDLLCRSGIREQSPTFPNLFGGRRSVSLFQSNGNDGDDDEVVIANTPLPKVCTNSSRMDENGRKTTPLVNVGAGFTTTIALSTQGAVPCFAAVAAILSNHNDSSM